jgi:hypothetical protein
MRHDRQVGVSERVVFILRDDAKRVVTKRDGASGRKVATHEFMEIIREGDARRMTG